MHTLSPCTHIKLNGISSVPCQEKNSLGLVAFNQQIKDMYICYSTMYVGMNPLQKHLLSVPTSLTEHGLERGRHEVRIG